MAEDSQVTTDKIRQLYHAYYENEELMSKMENQLFEEADTPEEWVDRLKERSATARRLYEENVAMIADTLNPLIENPKLVTSEILSAFQEENVKVRQEGRLDRKLILPLLEVLIQNEDSLPFTEEERWQIYDMRSDCVILALAENSYDSELQAVGRAVIPMSQYQSYSIEKREMSIRSSYNEFVVKCVCSAFSYGDILKEGKCLLEDLCQEDVIADEKKFKHISLENYIYFTKMNMVEVYYNKKAPSEAERKVILTYVEELCREDTEQKDINLSVYALYWKYLDGQLTANEYFEQVFSIYQRTMARPKYFETLSEIQETKEVPGTFYIGADVAYALNLTDYKEDKKRKLYEVIIEEFFRSVRDVRRGRFDPMLSDFIQKFLVGMAGYNGSLDHLVEIIANLTIKQQIQTFLHSAMVEKISNKITGYLLEDYPSYFCGFREYETTEDVQAHKKEILRYVRYASLLHDIGKVSISEIVNMQTRKISNSEYKRILRHPKLGVEMVWQIPFMQEYIDVIMGHHKFFDGSKGYPEEYDAKNSRYKAVVDLIAVCDSIDAATDVLGRNYAQGKDYDAIFTELKRESGSRYSDVLVDFLEKTPLLQTELRNLTGKEREQVYYEVYSNYFPKQKSYRDGIVK